MPHNTFPQPYVCSHSWLRNATRPQKQVLSNTEYSFLVYDYDRTTREGASGDGIVQRQNDRKAKVPASRGFDPRSRRKREHWTSRAHHDRAGSPRHANGIGAMGCVVTLRSEDTIPRRGRQRNADGELAQKRKTSDERDRRDSPPHEAGQEEHKHRRKPRSIIWSMHRESGDCRFDPDRVLLIKKTETK